MLTANRGNPKGLPIFFKMDYSKVLFEKIRRRRARVGIIGIGYVGDALGKGARGAGFDVLGLTRDPEKAKRINSDKSFGYSATSNIEDLKRCDIVCICVPTPIKNDKTPDLDPLVSSLAKTSKILTPATLVIIESTVAAGTTRNIVLPILKMSGLSEEKDFYLSFSPERVDPGNLNYGINNTPKVVSGLSITSKNLTHLFYSSFIESVVSVSSLETAEMSKLLENAYRFINISFMNELLDYANSLGVNLWEVIEAASSKPFGFMPHYPGPGIGGHCIPVDPYYLLDDAKKRGIELGILERAGFVNDLQPRKVVEKTIEVLKKTNGVKNSHSALLVGISYKEDTPDNRESPSLIIWSLLKENKIKVDYHDPYFPAYNGARSIDLSSPTINKKDIIVLTTPHSTIDYERIISLGKPIIDTKNALKNYSYPHIYRI